jgi:hypothetical protein
MPDLKQDWLMVQAGVGEMQDFLLSPDLYRPLGAREKLLLPQLSYGGMLLAFHRLQFSQEYSGSVEMKTIHSRFLQICEGWKQNAENKAGREYSARLRQWTHSFAEIEAGPEAKPGNYSYEIRLRVMLELFSELYPVLEKDADPLLSGLDQRLRIWLAKNPQKQPAQNSSQGFIWESDLERGFSKERFWYLYIPQVTEA